MTEAARTLERRPLSRERVLHAAVALADREGIEAVSMRRLAQELGIEAMGLYRRVRDKDDIVDGAIDAVMAEIEVGTAGNDWRTAMRALAMTARRVMQRHVWAPRVITDRKNVGPATLRHIDRALLILERGGFTLEMAHHALHVLGSRILGFTQDPFDDSDRARPETPPADEIARALAAYPNVAKLAVAARHDGALGGCDDDFEFEFGLDLILDGLERRRKLARTGTSPTENRRSGRMPPAARRDLPPTPT
jgi:AcrR family transcriptional regulator